MIWRFLGLVLGYKICDTKVVVFQLVLVLEMEFKYGNGKVTILSRRCLIIKVLEAMPLLSAIGGLDFKQ